MIQFSVIFCTYNREEYIYNALKSIAEQNVDVASYEILLVDNNSNDGTKQLCEKFQKNYPQVNYKYFLETNQGLSYARNRGVAESQGEVLVFVDDDATAFDGYLKSIDDLFTTYPDASACGGPIVPVYEIEKPSWLSPYTEQLLGGALYEGAEVKPFKNGKFPGGGNSAFRREVFDKYGLFNVDLGRKGTGLIGAEEKDLYDRLTRGGEKFYYLPGMGIHHYIPAKKLSASHFKELTYSIGKSEQIRTKSVSQSAYISRLLSEAKKWLGTIVLLCCYTIKLSPNKGWKLIEFRWNVTRGLLTK